MKKKIVGIFICLMLVTTVIPLSLADSTNLKISNINDDKWMQTYGGLNDDIGTSVQQTSDGGYIVVGETSKSNDNVTSIRCLL